MDTTVQPTADEAILFVSSMQAASNDSYQSTLQALKASTSRAVRAEMVDRIIDGAAILPSSTYQRFIVLLPHDTVAGSLRSLLPLVTLPSRSRQAHLQRCRSRVWRPATRPPRSGRMTEQPPRAYCQSSREQDTVRRG